MRYVHVLFLILPIYNVASFDFHNNDCDTYNDYRVWMVSPNCQYNPDVLSDAETMMKRNGYQYEIYTITTPDSYVLTIYRIPPKVNDLRKNKQPIFLQHGLFISSAYFVFNRNNSMAFALADQGYDVWMGNVRGTTYSRNHEYLTVDDVEYWNFNLDTLTLDLKQLITFVADKTKKPGCIIYVGHSLGTTLGFMYASKFHEEAHRYLKGIIALAPVVYFKNVVHLKRVMPLAPLIKATLDKAMVNGLFYSEESFRGRLVRTCRSFPILCQKALEYSHGNMTDQFLPNYLLLYYSYFITGVSTSTLVHYAQIGSTDEFAEFNHGRQKNMDLYGQYDPPKYRLSNIRMPVYQFYGPNDDMATKENAERILEELGSKEKELYRTPANNLLPGFNHLHFIIAKDIDRLFYGQLFRTLQELTV